MPAQNTLSESPSIGRRINWSLHSRISLLNWSCGTTIQCFVLWKLYNRAEWAFIKLLEHTSFPTTTLKDRQRE